MKQAFLFLIFAITINIYAQDKPVYPEPKNGFKRVDLMLPKLDDKEENYKIEVHFGRIASLTECEEGSFTFKLDNLKKQYGIPTSTRFPYYFLENDNGDINIGKKSGCNSTVKVGRKILSDQSILIEYQSFYVRPFYIPETWTVEYRIWAASDYISIDK